MSTDRPSGEGEGASKAVRRADLLKRMADMLKQGAIMLDLQCPACASPLFRLRSGEIWCANCQKRVVVVKESQDILSATSDILLSSLEEAVLLKLKELDRMLREEKDLKKLEELGSLLSRLLETLERIRRMPRRR